MQAVVNAFYECQRKLGTGYLSAFPSELFDRFEAIQPVRAPYYTIHKIMTGLLDQYKLAGSVQVLRWSYGWLIIFTIVYKMLNLNTQLKGIGVLSMRRLVA